jgi:hypothetical protein
MSKVFLIFTLFALIVSVTVTAAHAHVEIDTPSEISSTIHLDSDDDHNDLGNQNCEMACGGCCIHHVMNSFNQTYSVSSLSKEKLHILNTDVFVSDFIYGLKRPPRS